MDPSQLHSNIYTEPADAVAHLRHRRRVYMRRTGDELEDRLFTKPYAVLFRNLATPNFELERFVSLSMRHGLTPLVCEYWTDKFVTCNSAKAALANLRFRSKPPGIEASMIRKISVVDSNVADGRAFSTIATKWGQSFVEFHHQLVARSSQAASLEYVDASAWYKSNGGTAKDYYTPFFAMLSDRAVLFESYLLSSPSEAKFTSEVILPSFYRASERTGRKPLICRLDPVESEGDPTWYHYPMELESFASIGIKMSLKPQVRKDRACFQIEPRALAMVA